MRSIFAFFLQKSYICDTGQPETYLMKVYAFILVLESGQFLNPRISFTFITLFGVPCILHCLHTGVEFSLFGLWLSRATEQIDVMLHTFTK